MKYVRLNWKILRLTALPALLMLLGAGCSGVHAKGSVSPATFFMPGLLQVDPPRAQPNPAIPSQPADEPGTVVAQF